MDNVGLMRPGPTIAAQEEEERRRREEGYLGLMAAISEPLTYAPNPLISGVASVANRVGAEGWQKGLASGAADLVMNLATRNGPSKIKMYEKAGQSLGHQYPDVMDAANRKRFQGTGLFYDKAGNLLKEFSDDAAKPTGKFVLALNDALTHKDYKRFQTQKLGDFLEHPELYMRHPELADVPVSIGFSPGGDKYGGAFNPSGQKMKVLAPGKATKDNPLLALLHETQHAIQSKEGLPQGSDYKAIERDLAASVTHHSDPAETLQLADKIKHEAFQRYLLTEGEMGARMTERRRPLTGIERRQLFPFDSNLDTAGKTVPAERRILTPYDQVEIDKIARRLLGIPENP